jgi:hypothetical protein
MRSGLWFSLVAVVAGLAVGLVGAAWAGEAGRAGVWWGAGMGFAAQLLGFWLLFVLLLPGRRALAHGLGMLTRFGLVAAVALVGLPMLGVAAAPTLLSLVTVLFVTTLAEPVVLQIATKTRR